jgi:hypothetical protein
LLAGRDDLPAGRRGRANGNDFSSLEGGDAAVPEGAVELAVGQVLRGG